jgi:hypothetical protein
MFALIFLAAFAAIGALVVYLSRRIEHGEARFDASGRMISDRDPARPAQQIDQIDTTGDTK